MRFLKLVISVLFYILVRICLDSSFIALVVFIINIVFIFKPNPYIDKGYISFIKKANNYKSIEDALRKEKYHFSKENSKLIADYQKIITKEEDYKRFIMIQKDKNKMIIDAYNKRLLSYLFNSLCALLGLIIYYVFYKNSMSYYYYLYHNGYLYLFVLVILITLLNIYNMKLGCLKLYVDTKDIDDYSLCFHKNVLSILGINNDHLLFDEKGYVKEMKFITKAKISLCSYNFIAPLLALIFLVGYLH